ncbi:MAG TPA: copper resistance protein NlpE N-terminal domain-containing protein [Flavisolibacter sp.]|nr:copper resistance protein NlpE N-terminal domain-containing protein [Flavisolibacter sp.]
MRFCLLILVCCVISCNNEAQAPILTEDSAQPDGTELNDTAPVVVADTSQSYSAKTITPPQPLPAKLPQGFYRGVLPCEDCAGIEHTVYFLPNKTYVLEETNQGQSPAITKTTGSFNPSSGTIWAYKGQVVNARYTWGGDTLYYLMPNKKRVALQKLMAATDNDAWRKKGKEGLAFYAVGNEPFWNLEIGPKSNLAFHQAEWAKPLQFTNAKLTTAGDSVVYTASSDTASLKAVIYNRFCSDGMSDYIYSNSLRVEYNGKTFTGCGIKY